jgi:hypothetical protein
MGPWRIDFGCKLGAKRTQFAPNYIEIPTPKHPVSLLECMAGTTGLEPATSAVTGQRSNQLSYVPRLHRVVVSNSASRPLEHRADTKTSNPTTGISLSDSSKMLLPHPPLSSILVDHPQQLVVHGLSLLG